MSHLFDESYHQGLQGEAILDQHFDRWFTIRPASAIEQRQGIDRWYIRRIPDGRQRVMAIEYKTDYRAVETGNAFIEIISIDSQAKGGWAYRSQADYLMYYLPQADLVYMLSLQTIRTCLSRWAGEYPIRPAQNKAYNTWGILIALREFERYAYRVIPIGREDSLE